MDENLIQVGEEDKGRGGRGASWNLQVIYFFLQVDIDVVWILFPSSTCDFLGWILFASWNLQVKYLFSSSWHWLCVWILFASSTCDFLELTLFASWNQQVKYFAQLDIEQIDNLLTINIYLSITIEYFCQLIFSIRRGWMTCFRG